LILKKKVKGQRGKANEPRALWGGGGVSKKPICRRGEIKKNRKGNWAVRERKKRKGESVGPKGTRQPGNKKKITTQKKQR